MLSHLALCVLTMFAVLPVTFTLPQLEMLPNTDEQLDTFSPAPPATGCITRDLVRLGWDTEQHRVDALGCHRVLSDIYNRHSRFWTLSQRFLSKASPTSRIGVRTPKVYSAPNTECRLVIAFFKDIERWRVPQDFSRLDLRETEVVKTYETFSNHAKRIVEDCMDNRVAPLAGWSPYETKDPIGLFFTTLSSPFMTHLITTGLADEDDDGGGVVIL